MSSKLNGLNTITLTSQLINSGTTNATSKTDTAASLHISGGAAIEKDLFAQNVDGGFSSPYSSTNFDGSGSFVFGSVIIDSRAGKSITATGYFNAQIGTADTIYGGITFTNLIPNDFTISNEAFGVCIANCVSGTQDKIVRLDVVAGSTTKYITFILSPNQTATPGDLYQGSATFTFVPQ